MIDIVEAIRWIIQIFIISFTLIAICMIGSVIFVIFKNKLPKFKPRYIYRDETGIHCYKWNEMVEVPEWLNNEAQQRSNQPEIMHIIKCSTEMYMISFARDRKSYTVYQRC